MKDKMLKAIRKIRDADYRNTKDLSFKEVINYYHQQTKGFDKLIGDLKIKQKIRKVG